MNCGYCNGTGERHDRVRGTTYECVECAASGTAKCYLCGDDAEFVDDDGEYTCGDCWQESQMETV